MRSEEKLVIWIIRKSVLDQLCSKKQIGLCASDDERAWEKRVVIENSPRRALRSWPTSPSGFGRCAESTDFGLLSSNSTEAASHQYCSSSPSTSSFHLNKASPLRKRKTRGLSSERAPANDTSPGRSSSVPSSSETDEDYVPESSNRRKVSRGAAIKIGYARSGSKRSRRTLPEVGSVERKEILKEDAKRRFRQAANRHACPHCSYRAPFPSTVRRHIASKHNGAHACDRCDKRFDNHSQLRSHLAADHPRIHRCRHCEFSHRVLAEVRKHSIANHERGVVCTMAGCNMRVSRWRLKRHLKDKHGDAPSSAHPRRVLTKCSQLQETACTLVCAHCDFISNEMSDFNQHVMNAHERGILCPMPDCTDYLLLGALEDHLRSVHDQQGHAGGGQLPCNDECSESCSSSVPVPERRVLASCTTATMSECVSTSNASDGLSSDAEDFETTEKRSFANLTGDSTGLQCGLCGKSYRNSSLLRKHIRSVHDKAYSKYRRARKHVCDWEGCQKSFTTPGLLDDHINYHKGVTPYRCNACDRSFFARARFAVHLSKYHKTSIRDYSSVSELLTLSRPSGSATG